MGPPCVQICWPWSLLATGLVRAVLSSAGNMIGSPWTGHGLSWPGTDHGLCWKWASHGFGWTWAGLATGRPCTGLIMGRTLAGLVMRCAGNWPAMCWADQVPAMGWPVDMPAILWDVMCFGDYGPAKIWAGLGRSVWVVGGVRVSFSWDGLSCLCWSGLFRHGPAMALPAFGRVWSFLPLAGLGWPCVGEDLGLDVQGQEMGSVGHLPAMGRVVNGPAMG